MSFRYCSPVSAQPRAGELVPVYVPVGVEVPLAETVCEMLAVAAAVVVEPGKTLDDADTSDAPGVDALTDGINEGIDGGVTDALADMLVVVDGETPSDGVSVFV